MPTQGTGGELTVPAASVTDHPSVAQPSASGAEPVATPTPTAIAPEEIVVLPEAPSATPETEEPEQVQTMVNADCASATVTATDTTVLVPADIIIAVDTSSSMTAEAAFVQEELNRFSQQIIDSGVDARVILLAAAGAGEVADAGVPMGNPLGGRGPAATICIAPPLGSGNCPDDSNLPSYFHLNQNVGSNDALNLFIDTYAQWREHLRPESLKAFLIVSDDDATDAPNASAEAFTQNVQALDGAMFQRWNFNAVYSFTQCGELAAAIGGVYRDLVAQTAGVEGDLCEQDFQPVFDQLATQIVDNAGAEIVCQWDVPAVPEGQTFSTDLVEVTRRANAQGSETQALSRVLGPADCVAGAWHFDDNYDPTSIVACPDTCEAIQGSEVGGGIDVAFGCEVVEGCAATAEAVLGAEGAAGGVACEWPLPSPDNRQELLDLESVNVRYTTSTGFGVLMGQVPAAGDCATADLAWYFDDPTQPTKIVACPATCDVLTANGITTVKALFGCETRPAKPRTL